MSPYGELTKFLMQIPTENNYRTLSFNEIETIVKRKLPASARHDRTLWANTYQRYYARFWLQAGWKVESVDFQKGNVLFSRQAEQPSRPHRNRNEKNGELGSPMPSKHSGFAGIPVPLNDEEFRQISSLGKTADKAIEVVKKHLRDSHGENIEIHVGSIQGADLRVVFQDGKEQLIEVKGTSNLSVSWSQLKVSSQQSYEKLCAGIPLYRVINVNSKTPQILVLKYGRDFKMKPEPRWAVTPSRR